MFSLPVQTGDVIKLVTRVNPEWVRGEMDGRSGILPASFVDDVPPLPAAKETPKVMGILFL